MQIDHILQKWMCVVILVPARPHSCVLTQELTPTINCTPYINDTTTVTAGRSELIIPE